MPVQNKILLILPSYGVGGAENYALRLIKFAGTKKFEWHVTSGNLNDNYLEPAFESVGARVHYASPRFGFGPASFGFFSFLRQFNFDVVMSLTGIFAGVPLAIARVADVPARIAWHRRSSHAYALTPLRRWYTRMAFSMLDWGSTRILSNSEAALDFFHGSIWRNSNKFAVIPNGVDGDRFRPETSKREVVRQELGFSKSDFVIGHVGRIDPAKDHDTLFQIVRELSSHTPNVRLLMAGIRTDSKEVANQLLSLGISSISVGVGVKDNVEELYPAMDVFVFPSVTEGQPNALIEAMLSGVPIVASDIPPIREAVPEFLSKRLFEPGDVSAACKAISEARRDSKQLADSAREWALKRYSTEKNFGRVLEVFEN